MLEHDSHDNTCFENDDNISKVADDSVATPFVLVLVQRGTQHRSWYRSSSLIPFLKWAVASTLRPALCSVSFAVVPQRFQFVSQLQSIAADVHGNPRPTGAVASRSFL